MGEPTPPPGDVISFDEATFDRLILFIDDTNKTLNSKFLAATTGFQLDGSLKTFLRAGNPAWKAVEDLQTAAGTWGTSMNSTFKALSKEWTTFSGTLRYAKTVLKRSNEEAIDLASIPASALLDDVPGLAPPGASGSGGAFGSGGGFGFGGIFGPGGTSGSGGASGSGGSAI